MNQENESQGSLAECFSKKHIKRTMVATSMFFIQNASGNAWVIGYMSYFMQLAGMSAARSFDTTVGMSGLMVVGNMCGWVFVEKFGRRNTALYGTGILTIALFLIGVLACIKSTNAIWGQVVFMGIWSFGTSHPSLSLHTSQLTPSQSIKEPSALPHGPSAPRTRPRVFVRPRSLSRR